MPEPATKQQPPGLYYGWKVVVGLMIVLTFASGLSFYNHAIYLNALATQQGFSVSTASLAVSVFFLSSGVAGLLVGKWVQEFDVRLSFTVGAILCFLALSCLALVTELWQLLLLYTVFGAGFAASALLPATTLITRWFRRRRAMALSVASTGLSLGGVIVTPFSVYLVENFGFSTAAPVMGLMYLVGVIPVSWLYLQPEPAALGLRIDGGRLSAEDGQQQQQTAARSAGEQGVSLREARRGKLFWGISLAYVFLLLAQVGGIAHQYGLARELLSESQTALAVAILPVASIIGRLIGGYLVEQMAIRRFAIAMIMTQVTSLLLLASGVSVWTLFVGLFMLGTSVGNLLMLQPLLLAEAFGVREYARIFSISNLMSSWGTAAGPALMGVVYAASGQLYAMPYLVAGLAGFLGLLLFLFGGDLHAYHQRELRPEQE